MTRTKSARAKALLAKKKVMSGGGACVKATAEQKWRPAKWRVVHAGHSFVRRLKAAHLGGSHLPHLYKDTTKSEGRLLAEKLCVTSKVKSVRTLSEGVAGLNTLMPKVRSIKELNPNMVLVHGLTNHVAHLGAGATDQQLEEIAKMTVSFARQFSQSVSVVFMGIVPRVKGMACTPEEFARYAESINQTLRGYARQAGSQSVPRNYRYHHMQGWWPSGPTLGDSHPLLLEDGIHPVNIAEKYSRTVNKAILAYKNTPPGVL